MRPYTSQLWLVNCVVSGVCEYFLELPMLIVIYVLFQNFQYTDKLNLRTCWFKVIIENIGTVAFRQKIEQTLNVTLSLG